MRVSFVSVNLSLCRKEATITPTFFSDFVTHSFFYNKKHIRCLGFFFCSETRFPDIQSNFTWNKSGCETSQCVYFIFMESVSMVKLFPATRCDVSRQLLTDVLLVFPNALSKVLRDP